MRPNTTSVNKVSEKQYHTKKQRESKNHMQTKKNEGKAKDCTPNLSDNKGD